MTEHTDEQVKTWERHVSTIASAVVIALLMWLGSSVIEMGQDISVIKVRLNSAIDIQQSLTSMQKEQGEMRINIMRIKTRVDRVEQAQSDEDERERKEHRGNL